MSHNRFIAPRRPRRRAILGGGLALLASAGLGPIGCAVGPQGRIATGAGGRFSADPFTLGIASGDPLHDRVVLWTRLAPRPLDDDGGMGRAAVPVRWQIALDEKFSRIVGEGEETAIADHCHSVHAEASGLAPGRTYFYRFIAGGAASPVGRTRTAPAPATDPGVLRFANVGCQNFEAGFYTAYRHLAAEDLDLVVHTGDYIYEGAAKRNRTGLVRWHPRFPCGTLAEYRMRYALYKSDPDLRAAHAAHPFAVVFDDHEVADNWAGDMDGRGRRSDGFMARRAAGFKAWWEHMPVRRAPPTGAGMRIYRGLDFGRLARISLCDTRQYRTQQPCGGDTAPRCGADMDASAQMLGAAQERWLGRRLKESTARWNVIAQQVPMAAMNRSRDGAPARYHMDKWDGYGVPRRRLLAFLAEARIGNPVVLSGDIHRHVAAELRPDFAHPETRAVATEFVNTSISSRGDGNADSKAAAAWLRHNPHLKMACDLRGYVRHTVTAAAWRADFQVIDKVTQRGAPIRTERSFAVASGRPDLLTA